MTVDELARKLTEMYENANETEQNTMVLLFGIRYSTEITKNKISCKNILKFTNLKNDSQLTKGWENEIRKGVKLARCVEETYNKHWKLHCSIRLGFHLWRHEKQTGMLKFYGGTENGFKKN